jgi:hypothetical protein
MKRTIMSALAMQLSAGLLALGVFTAMPWWLPSEDAHEPMQKWGINAFVEHLRSRGLEFRSIGTLKNGDPSWGVYLTTTDKSWEELNSLGAMVERLPEWRGTVYCALLGKAPEEGGMIELWGEGGERLGRFGLFGDPKLRAKIRQAALSPAVE